MFTLRSLIEMTLFELGAVADGVELGTITVHDGDTISVEVDIDCGTQTLSYFDGVGTSYATEPADVYESGRGRWDGSGEPVAALDDVTFSVIPEGVDGDQVGMDIDMPESLLAALVDEFLDGRKEPVLTWHPALPDRHPRNPVFANWNRTLYGLYRSPELDPAAPAADAFIRGMTAGHDLRDALADAAVLDEMLAARGREPVFVSMTMPRVMDGKRVARAWRTLQAAEEVARSVADDTPPIR